MGPCGRLRVVDGRLSGEVHDLDEGELALGRDPGAAICLAEPTVSKNQAVLHCRGGAARIENRSPRNPTLVNGIPLEGPKALRDGDRIAAGDVNLVYEAPAAPVRAAPRPRRDPARPPEPPPSREPEPEPEPAHASGREEGAHGTRMLRRPWLVVQQAGEAPRDETLFGDIMRVGRSPECEVRLDFAVVSGHHARLELKGGRYSIADTGSTNGTFVNGRLLDGSRDLQDGDIIRIGDPSGNSVSMTYHEEGSELRDELGTVAVRRLQVEGKDSFVLGRDAACDVKLDASLVSWKHARVDRVEGGHAITDLRSTNGTFVNGQPVRGRRMLKPGDIIHIGPYKFVYTAAGFNQSSSAGHVRVDGVGLRREVGKGKTTRVLLNDISITVKPREFVCFVGGSGAGKSTLMKACAGIFHVDGRILLNGEDLVEHYDAWKAMLGYVPQDDIVHGDLTVDHAVRYSAKLRLPKDTKRAELDKAVDRVLGDVEMTSHRDKLIRSLSGGQRKRVSIAVEMLSEPSLFFLDEPTSGLDPGLEKKMMYMMRRLADGGRTIIMVTHATANITQCDHVAFLARGRLVWYGPPTEALEHFGVRDFSDIYTEIEKDPEGLEKKYRASAACRKYVLERQKVLTGKSSATGSFRAGGGRPVLEKRTAGSLRQFYILTRRYAELVFRDHLLLGILLAVMPAIGLMLAAMAHPHDLVGKTPDVIAGELEGKAGEISTFEVVGSAEKLLFMTALAVVLLGLFGAAYEVVKERPVYRRERMVNLHIGPYLMSKVLVLFGFALLQCGALLGALWLKVTIPDQGVLMSGPLEIYVTLVLTALASILMGLFVSALAPNANTVIYMILLVVFAQILLTGTIFKLPEPARPASYAVVTRWSLESLGSTVDMERLNGQTQTLMRRTITMEYAPKPEDLGKAFKDLVDQGAVPAPGPQKIEKKINEPLKTPVDLQLRYGHDRGHLIFLWSVLAGFAVAFAALTAAVLSWKDRQEG
jgi:ABC-type multidrug transport system ATPase subunit/pSer/pThr/pTyr-binding forkhead associated (FHA) protein